MKRLLIVGQSFSGLVRSLKSQGYSYIILKDSSSPKTSSLQGEPGIIIGDFSSRESILQAVEPLRGTVDGTIALYEQYILPAAWITEYLNLPGLSPAAALACTDKWEMRRAFAQAPEAISPDFAIVKNEQDLRDFASNHTFPLMLKPANLVKSLLITKSDSLPALLEAYRQTMDVIDKVYATYAPNRQPKLIVEEFLEGSMHTVAGFADKEGMPHIVDGVVDLKIAREAGFDDTFLYSRRLPSQLSSQQQTLLKHTAEIGMRALGIQSSPAHVEIILTTAGPKIVEIGARNGGYRERMYSLANGLLLGKAAIDVALGSAPQLETQKREHCIVYELFPDETGAFVEIAQEQAIKTLPSCAYYRCVATPGKIVGKAAEGFKRCAIVILHSKTAEQCATDAAFLEAHAKVIVKPVLALR